MKVDPESQPESRPCSKVISCINSFSSHRALWDGYYYCFHFPDKDTEAQRSSLTCPGHTAKESFVKINEFEPSSWLQSPAPMATMQVEQNGFGSTYPAAGPDLTMGLCLTIGCCLVPMVGFLLWRPPGMLIPLGYPRVPCSYHPPFQVLESYLKPFWWSWHWALLRGPRRWDWCHPTQSP